MAINPEDVKLFESQVMADEDNGGGRATGTEVIDGQINNVFPDISRLDRTLGDVALRKVFLGIDTDNADTYLGAHSVITEAAQDPNVNFVIFDAGSEDDRRSDARNRVESYVVRGSRALFELLGNQYEGQRQLAVIQPEDRPIPSAGDVFLVQRSDESEEQYVRVTEVDSEVLTFTYQSDPSTFVDFDRRRLTLSISAPLNHTFYGGEPTPAGTTELSSTGQEKSELFSTEVADAARYWGVSNTELEVQPGDLDVTVKQTRSNLVPSAQTEQSLSDQAIGLDQTVVKRASESSYTTPITATYISSTDLQVFLPRAAIRGTVALSLGGSNYSDPGDGVLTRTTGSFPFTELKIDYVTGQVTGQRDSGTGGGDVSGNVTFQPGVPFRGKADSYDFPITLANRSFNYNFSFPSAKPRPGTVVVAYLVQGRWSELRDNGAGVLEGQGSGSVDFQTGTISITAQELPDVGSSVLVNYIVDIFEEIETHEGTYPNMIPDIKLQLQEGIEPSSLTINYTADGLNRTVTDDGSGGLIGDGGGTIDYASGETKVDPLFLPDDGTDVLASYDRTTGTETAVAPPVVGGEVTDTLSGAPLAPNSIEVRTVLAKFNSDRSNFNVLIKDDGNGGWTGGYTGSINYSTGEYTLGIKQDWQQKRHRKIVTWEQV